MEVYWGVIITRHISSEKIRACCQLPSLPRQSLTFSQSESEGLCSLPAWIHQAAMQEWFFFQLQMFPSRGKHRYKYSFLCLKRKWLPITVYIPRGFLASTRTGRWDRADWSLRGLPFTSGPRAKCTDIFRLCRQLRYLVIMVNSDISHSSWSFLISPGIVAAQ